VALRPRAVAVLRYLVEHPGRLVTKAELRRQVWGDTHVTDTVLRVCVREIRAALGDAAAAPQYVATVGQEGYRFLGGGELEPVLPPTPGPLVGRQREVARLEGWFERAAGGQRQLGFVSGEAGVGKTTVVELWLGRLAARGGVRVGRGQCVEPYGGGEPYLPWFEVLGRLARGPGGAAVVAALRRYAPMWLVQLPGLVSELEVERLQRQVQGATPARMVRELAEVFDVLAAEAPLVVVLEDLHWSDHSSLEGLSSLAQRREPARLVMLGTYRPAEAVIREHPLRGLVQELCGRGQAAALRLEVLPAADVAAYVAGRLGGPAAAALAAFIAERTDGNALFMVNLLEHLVQQGEMVRRGGEWTLREEAEKASVPEGLRQLLLRRLEALEPEARRVLEAASVVGEAFAVAAVAAGVQGAVEAIEAVCEELAAQQHFLDATGVTSWPDGTSTGSYRFRHALYQQVLYEGLGAARRTQLHRRIGTQLEAGHGAQAGEIAAQLAVHFERGGRGRAGRALSAAGGRQCHPTQCPSRSDRCPQERNYVAGHAPGRPGAHPARTHAAAPPGGTADGGEGHGSSRGGRGLQLGARALPTARGAAAALRGTLRPDNFSCHSRAVRHRSRIRPTALRYGATPARSGPAAREPDSHGGYRPLSGRPHRRHVLPRAEPRDLRCPVGLHLHCGWWALS
jgi:hypothetical protein